VLKGPSARIPPETIRDEMPSSEPQWRTRTADNGLPLQSFMSCAMGHSPETRTAPVDNDPLFEELASRLEQALAEQGIDVEP